MITIVLGYFYSNHPSTTKITSKQKFEFMYAREADSLHLSLLLYTFGMEESCACQDPDTLFL